MFRAIIRGAAEKGKTYPSSPDVLSVFNCSPISIWIEDFSEINARINNLKKNGIKDFRCHFRKHPEEVISLTKAVKILEINDATMELYEARNREELLRDLSLVFDKDSYDVFREEIIALAEGKTEFSSETTQKTLKGNLRHILIKVIVVPRYASTLSRVFVFIIDITESKESQKELKESEAKYRTIVEFAPDALLLIDADTGIILEANRRAERLFGLLLNQIVGMHFAQLLWGGGTERYQKIIQDHEEDGCWALNDVVVLRKSGERAFVSARSCLVCIQERRCVLMVFQETDKSQEDTRKPDSPGSADGDHSFRGKALGKLSRREQDVIRHISDGLTNRQIAKTLFISIKTVETHRARIMDKLGFHKTADIVRFAIFSGLCKDKFAKSKTWQP